jgi:hypothetical protein
MKDKQKYVVEVVQNDNNYPLVRIADALEEILRLVKLDQERSKKYLEDQKDEI